MTGRPMNRMTFSRATAAIAAMTLGLFAARVVGLESHWALGLLAGLNVWLAAALLLKQGLK